MGKEKEIDAIKQLYLEFHDAPNWRLDLKYEKLGEALRLYQMNLVPSQAIHYIDDIKKEFFFPRDQFGKLDMETHRKRIEFYNDKLIERRIEMGERIDRLRKKFDQELGYGGFNKELKLDNNLILASRYVQTSPIGLEDSTHTSMTDFFMELNKYIPEFTEEDCDKYFLEMRDELLARTEKSESNPNPSLSGRDLDMYKLGETPPTGTEYVLQHFDESANKKDIEKYYKDFLTSEIPSKIVGNREVDYENLAKFDEWSNQRNNPNLEKLMLDISTHKKSSGENSDFYQKIIDTYKKVFDATTSQKFVEEMENLQTACREYINNRNPWSPSGKQRMGYVKQLEHLLTKSLIPLLYENVAEKVTGFEEVDMAKVEADMEAEERAERERAESKKAERERKEREQAEREKAEREREERIGHVTKSEDIKPRNKMEQHEREAAESAYKDIKNYVKNEFQNSKTLITQLAKNPSTPQFKKELANLIYFSGVQSSIVSMGKEPYSKASVEKWAKQITGGQGERQSVESIMKSNTFKKLMDKYTSDKVNVAAIKPEDMIKDWQDELLAENPKTVARDINKTTEIGSKNMDGAKEEKEIITNPSLQPQNNIPSM